MQGGLLLGEQQRFLRRGLVRGRIRELVQRGVAAALASGAVERAVAGYGGEPGRPAAALGFEALDAVPDLHTALADALLAVGVVGEYGRDDVAHKRPEVRQQRLYSALVPRAYALYYFFLVHQPTPSLLNCSQ